MSRVSTPRRRPRQRVAASGWSLLAPRHWPLWLGVVVAWCIAQLPMPVLRWLGAPLGRIATRLAPARRRIADANLARCFPELDQKARDALRNQVFQDYGIAALETLVAWLGPIDRLLSNTQFIGLERLEHARAQGRGVLLLGAHFATLDLAGALLSRRTSLDATYRYNKNPVLEWLMRRGRTRRYSGVIERADVRTMVRRLRTGHVVWYAADQDYGPKHSVFAPFFGVPAATITAPARIAKLTGAEVLFFAHFRDPGTHGYRLEIQALPVGYAGADSHADARLQNAHIEAQVRRAPSQYLWMHRRFKTQPGNPPLPANRANTPLAAR